MGKGRILLLFLLTSSLEIMFFAPWKSEDFLDYSFSSLIYAILLCWAAIWLKMRWVLGFASELLDLTSVSLILKGS